MQTVRTAIAGGLNQADTGIPPAFNPSTPLGSSGAGRPRANAPSHSRTPHRGTSPWRINYLHWAATCTMIVVMDNLLQDIRLALRRLHKAPLFAAVAVISISLGIGANTAVFSLLDQVLLRSLPVKDPDRLVLLKANGPRSGWLNANYDSDYIFSYPVYREFRDSKQFDGVCARAHYAGRLLAWTNRSRTGGNRERQLF